MVKDYLDKYLIVSSKDGRKQVDWKEYYIGNSEKSNFYIRSPLTQNLDDGNTYEIKLAYAHGKYWLINNSAKPLRDIYLRVMPDSPEIYLRPEDSIKMGSLELQLCRFNVGKAEEKGDRPSMEDRIVLIQDLGLNCRLDVSMFAVMDG